jgi:hypothetical protein
MRATHLALLCVYAVVSANSAWAQLYRCDAAGKTVYQEKPCDGDGGKKLNIRKEAPPGSHEARVQAAVAKGQVFPGMNEQEVVQSWGRPTRINRSVRANSVSEQWIYERGEVGSNQYLYLENGVLTSIQSPR